MANRFYRWCKAGVFEWVLQRQQTQADARGGFDSDLDFVGATLVRARQNADSFATLGPAPTVADRLQ